MHHIEVGIEVLSVMIKSVVFPVFNLTLLYNNAFDALNALTVAPTRVHD